MWDYKDSDERRLKSSDESWAAYRKVIDRSIRELGELKNRQFWVKAIDGSTTPSRESLDAAVAVLGADGLPFTYSFCSLSSEDGDRVDVFVWTDEQRVAITAYASSASRAKGLVAVATHLLDVLGATEVHAASVVVMERAALDEPARRKMPKWLLLVGTLVGGPMIAGAIALFWKFPEAWFRAWGWLP